MELSMLPRPTKIVCVGRNYVKHAEELGHAVPEEPLLFLKPPSSLVGDGDAIVLPPESGRVEHEGEIAVVIGSRCHRVDETGAMGCVAGFAALNDVTARDLQRRDAQWTRAKGFDTFCPLGPALETELDPQGLSVVCRVNGEVRQEATTDDMIFGVGEILEYVSAVMTLLPGDVILTGTPAGVGPIGAGDFVEVEVERIGILGNPVMAGP